MSRVEQRNLRRELKLSVIREYRNGIETLAGAAEKAGTTPLQVYRWRESDPEFNKALDNIQLYWMLDESEPDEAALMRRLERDVQDSILLIQRIDRVNRRWILDTATAVTR